MKKRTRIFVGLSSFILLLGILGCSSENKNSPSIVYQFSENKRIGYMDNSGKVVIVPKYVGGSSCSWNGLVSVADSENGEPYTINLRGEKVLTIQVGIFIDPEDNDRYAPYNSGAQSGILNRTGKLISYDLLGSLIDQHASLDLTNEGYLTVWTKGRYGLFSEKEGFNLISQEYAMAGVYSEGLLAVIRGDSDKAKLGFIDKSGDLVIPANYFDIEMTAAVAQGLPPSRFDYRNIPLSYRFSEGLAAVGFITDDGRSNFGYIDKKGNSIIKPSYTQARAFSGGYAAAGIDGDVFGKGTKYGFIDRAGHFVIPPQFDDAKEVKDGAAPVKIGKKWGLLNIALWKTTGKLVVDPSFDFIAHRYDLFMLETFDDAADQEYRWVDAKGNELHPKK